MSGDFEGERECVSHHACDCLQRKAAERDAWEGNYRLQTEYRFQAEAERDCLQSDLTALRRGVEAEIKVLRRRAELDEERSERPGRIGRDAAIRAVVHTDAADRLQAILDAAFGSTKPFPSPLDPSGGEDDG